MSDKQIDESIQGQAIVLEDGNRGTKKLFLESYGCAMNFSDSEIVASILSKSGYSTTDNVEEADVVFLETEIDEMNETLAPMKHFILPGGHQAISTTHIARCVCRRAERLCVNMQEHQLFIDPLVIKYINRLSDYLFVLSRYAGHLLRVSETVWKPRINK